MPCLIAFFLKILKAERDFTLKYSCIMLPTVITVITAQTTRCDCWEIFLNLIRELRGT